MADHIQKGKRGEDEAAKFLVAKGYRILERNWRYGRKEVDIIAEHEGMTIFVEVKTRTAIGGERYDEIIRPAKQKSMLAVSSAYMIRNRPGGKVRFDIIFVIGEGSRRHIEHIEDSFSSWG